MSAPVRLTDVLLARALHDAVRRSDRSEVRALVQRMGADPRIPVGRIVFLVGADGWGFELGQGCALAAAAQKPTILAELLSTVRGEHASLAIAGVACGRWFSIARPGEAVSMLELAVELRELDIVALLLAVPGATRAVRERWSVTLRALAREWDASDSSNRSSEFMARFIAAGAADDPDTRAWLQAVVLPIRLFGRTDPVIRLYTARVPLAFVFARRLHLGLDPERDAHYLALKKMLDAGLDPRSRAPELLNMTLLHAAVCAGHTQAARLLMQAGAVLHDRDAEGLTVVERALEQQRGALVAELQAFEASTRLRTVLGGRVQEPIDASEPRVLSVAMLASGERGGQA